LGYRPFHSAAENRLIIIIHAKDKAAIDHDSEVVQSPHGGVVVVPDILHFSLSVQITQAGCFKSHKQTAQATVNSLLQQLWLEDGIHCACGLPEPAHSA